MHFFAKTVSFAALSATLVSGETALRTGGQRELQDITDALCTACDVCDSLGDLCAINDLVDLACANCGSFGVDGLCDTCNACTSAGDLCDPQGVTDLGCGLCDIEIPEIPDIDTSTCFSEITTVQVLDNSGSATTTEMMNLKIGDRVLTQDGSFQSVYAFGHHHPTQNAKFFQIHSENADRPLEVTKDHLIFLQDQARPVPAESIKVGDVLRGATAGSTVTKIGSVERKGIYAPLTTSGTLLVDGVAASSYVHFTDKQQVLSEHDLIHLTLSPYRMLCNGVSAAFCDTRFYLDNGMPHYAHYGLELLNWLLSSNSVVKTLGMSTIFLLTGACQVLENVFGASLAPLLVFLAAAGYASQSKNKKSKAKTV